MRKLEFCAAEDFRGKLVETPFVTRQAGQRLGGILPDFFPFGTSFTKSKLLLPAALDRLSPFTTRPKYSPKVAMDTINHRIIATGTRIPLDQHLETRTDNDWGIGPICSECGRGSPGSEVRVSNQ